MSNGNGTTVVRKGYGKEIKIVIFAIVLVAIAWVIGTVLINLSHLETTQYVTSEVGKVVNPQAHPESYLSNAVHLPGTVLPSEIGAVISAYDLRIEVVKEGFTVKEEGYNSYVISDITIARHSSGAFYIQYRIRNSESSARGGVAFSQTPFPKERYVQNPKDGYSTTWSTIGLTSNGFDWLKPGETMYAYIMHTHHNTASFSPTYKITRLS